MDGQYKLPPTPRPPTMVTAPVVEDVEAVPLLQATDPVSVEFPPTVKVPLALIFVADTPANVEVPLTLIFAADTPANVEFLA